MVEYGRAELLKVVGDTPSPWCHQEPPLAYTYIQVTAPNSAQSYPPPQRVYWNNGFLAYWDAKQLPNFLIALPCLAMVLHHSYQFIQVSLVEYDTVVGVLLARPVKSPVARSIGTTANAWA